VAHDTRAPRSALRGIPRSDKVLHPFISSEIYQHHTDCWHLNIRLESGHAYHLRVHEHYHESLTSFAETDLFLIFVVAGDTSGLENAEKNWYAEVTENCPGVPIILVAISTNSVGSLPSMSADGYREKLRELLQRLPLLLSYVVCDDIGITEENVDTVLKKVQASSYCLVDTSLLTGRKVVEDLLKWRKGRCIQGGDRIVWP